MEVIGCRLIILPATAPLLRGRPSATCVPLSALSSVACTTRATDWLNDGSGERSRARERTLGRPRVWLNLWLVGAVLADCALGLLLADNEKTATRVGLVTVEGAYMAGGEDLTCASLGMHRGWVCLLGTLVVAFAHSGAEGLLSLGGPGAFVCA